MSTVMNIEERIRSVVDAGDADGIVVNEMQDIIDDVNATDPGSIADNRTEEEQLLHQVMRRRASLEAELRLLKEQTAAMIRETQNRLAALDYVYRPILEEIAARMIEGKKSKSIKTPFGVVGFRARPAHIEIVDENAIYAAAIDPNAKLPDDIVRRKIEISINKEVINSLWKEANIVVPGCEIVPESETFYMRHEKEKS